MLRSGYSHHGVAVGKVVTSIPQMVDFEEKSTAGEQEAHHWTAKGTVRYSAMFISYTSDCTLCQRGIREQDAYLVQLAFDDIPETRPFCPAAHCKTRCHVYRIITYCTLSVDAMCSKISSCSANSKDVEPSDIPAAARHIPGSHSNGATAVSAIPSIES